LVPRGFGGDGDFEAFRFQGRVERRSVVGIEPGRADTLGLRVDRVAPDGPAARAGVAAGDRLVAVDGQSLRVDRADAGDPLLAAVPARRLTRAVGRLAPGSDVELRFTRDGRERAVRVRTVAPTALADAAPGRPGDGPGRELRGFREFRPGERPRIEFFGPDGPGGDPGARDEARRRARAFADSARARTAARPVLGLTVGGTNSARDTLGLFVSAVAAAGPAERAGVVEGDRVAAINDVDLRVPRDERDAPEAAAARRARFAREVARLQPGGRATLRVWGDGRWRTVTATVARAGDVYRGGGVLGAFGPGAFGPGAFGDTFGGVPHVVLPGAFGPGDGPAVRHFRGLRRAPRPDLPGLRGVPEPRGFRAPAPPAFPRPPRAPGRVVTI
jgi:hypothetical protein